MYYTQDVKREYPPDVIDAAVIGTLKMILRGKAVVWQDHRMYLSGGFACINGQAIGDAVDAVWVWFERYSIANPRMGHWYENASTVAFLKRRWL